jgi:hypothetical protein
VATSEAVTSPLGPPPGLTLRARSPEEQPTYHFHRPPLGDGTVDWSGVPVHSPATSRRRNPPTGLVIRAVLPDNQAAGPR